MRPAHLSLSGDNIRLLRVVQVLEVAGGPREKTHCQQHTGAWVCGRFRTKDQKGRLEVEKRPSRSFEVPVGAHFTPLEDRASAPSKGRTPSIPAPRRVSSAQPADGLMRVVDGIQNLGKKRVRTAHVGAYM